MLGLSVFVDERAHPSDEETTASNVQGAFYLPDAPLLDAPYRVADDDEPRLHEIPKDGPVGRLLDALGRHAWRPAHLHPKVSHPGHGELTTMVHLEGDPWLDSDTIGSVKQPLVVAVERVPADDRWDRLRARCTFDVQLRPIG